MVYGTEFKVELLYRDNYKGYDYFVYNLGLHPTAYIRVGKNDMLYLKNTDDLCFLNVHGGITYAEPYLHGYELLYDTRSWFIGWDYSHYNDYSGLYLNNDYVLMDELGLRKWKTSEIINDCKDLIDDIIIINKLRK